MTATQRDAVLFVAEAIAAGDATPDEYDVEAIASDLYDLTGSWDMEIPGHDTFWAAVERHQR